VEKYIVRMCDFFAQFFRYTYPGYSPLVLIICQISYEIAPAMARKSGKSRGIVLTYPQVDLKEELHV